MNIPLLSVVIPTRNRAELLRGSLESLAAQSLTVDQYEVVVVDDGATDATRDVCAELATRMDLKYFFIEHSGISAAKNLGIFAARGSILFFFDDDDYASPNLLEEHLRSHQRRPQENIAVLGYTTWAPTLQVSELMHYVTEVGCFLFAYPHLTHGQELDFTYFWGGRSSCKKSFLAKHGVFNQQFRFGSEDIELGFRLSTFGLKVFYNGHAVQYMNRTVSYDEFCRRCEKQGRSQYFFSQLHPELRIPGYCAVTNSQRRWTDLRDALGMGYYNVREIEATLACQPDVPAPPKLVAELHRLYKWTFDGFKLKGIAGAQSLDALPAASPRQPPQPLVKPIVIYQMGKVGSKSIESGLAEARLGSPVCHSHMLRNLDRIEDETRRSRASPVETLQEVRHGRKLLKTLIGSDYIRCRIISLVRDPIARNISAFFQNITEFIPAVYERYSAGDLTVHDLISVFIESYNHAIPATWFDNQLRPVFGIDVFAQEFPRERGYAIYEGELADLLVIKLEQLESCAKEAIQEFLGLDDFRLAKVNAGEDKIYKDMYKEFCDAIVLPVKFMDSMYDSRLARHFYTDRELSQFKRRWMRSTVPCIVPH